VVNWQTACPMIIFKAAGDINAAVLLAVLLSGLLFSTLGSGSSVAKPNAARGSIIRLIQSHCAVVIFMPGRKYLDSIKLSTVIPVELVVTASWNWETVSLSQRSVIPVGPLPV